VGARRAIRQSLRGDAMMDVIFNSWPASAGLSEVTLVLRTARRRHAAAEPRCGRSGRRPRF
jgi:hypothetical protein